MICLFGFVALCGCCSSWILLVLFCVLIVFECSVLLAVVL